MKKCIVAMERSSQPRSRNTEYMYLFVSVCTPKVQTSTILYKCVTIQV